MSRQEEMETWVIYRWWGMKEFLYLPQAIEYAKKLLSRRRPFVIVWRCNRKWDEQYVIRRDVLRWYSKSDTLTKAWWVEPRMIVDLSQVSEWDIPRLRREMELETGIMFLDPWYMVKVTCSKPRKRH